MSKLEGLYGLEPEWIADELKAEAERRENIWREIEDREPRFAALRDLTIRALCSDKVAKASYFNLLRAGWRQFEFLELLVGMAVSVPRRGKAPNWLSGLGMTPKQMNYLPGRLNKLADEIEKLNGYPLLRPDIWLEGRKVSESAKKCFGFWFTRLPLLLRHYAAFTKGHSKDMRRFLWEKNRRAPRAEVLRALISLAQTETGRPRYKDLSAILSAAAHEAGLADSECAFDEPTLRVLGSRMQKK
jgi:hypothetical protein